VVADSCPVCCGVGERLNLPAEVIEALARYRAELGGRGWDWGDDRIEFFRWARHRLLAPVALQFAASGDWPAAIRQVLAGGVPAGTAVLRVGRDGGLRAEAGPARAGIAGRSVTVEVVVDSAADAAATVRVAGREVGVAALGAVIETVELDPAAPVIAFGFGERRLELAGVIRPSPAAWLRLCSSRCSRWSVTDTTDGGWFPDGTLAKWDYHQRPFFHGHDVTLAVPAGPLHVVCARGIEFDRVEVDVAPAAGETAMVECDPPRLFDPAADGWYGGDLHIHMNYSGDLVCTPADAARMQAGEGLHLANLVAANCQTSLVYDREMLEAFPDTDLHWSTDETVARMGVEYRNDLLGHVHALGPTGPPAAYYAGHERSDHPEDWPPNSVACAELRRLDATVGYCHPALAPFPADGSTNGFFAIPRSVEARELVADAALGLVDSIDVISPFDHEGAIFLYHRLLSCGLRLAATAGTDTFLSFSRLGTASNPPGWGRVYAHLGGQPLSVPAFKQAVRAGRTVVTNGPWLTLQVNGHGPGAVLDPARGDQLEIRARVDGPGAERLSLVGPGGELAAGPADRELRLDTTLDGRPAWIAAIARGPQHPHVLDSSVLAHTSPVYLDIAGQRVARAADARWCLDFLDMFDQFATDHGRFDPTTRQTHLGDILAVTDQAKAFYRQVARSANQ